MSPNRRRVQFGADSPQKRLARVAVIAGRAHLDELVRIQVDVDLVQHGRREAVRADRDDGLQVMSLRAQRPPRRRC